MLFRRQEFGIPRKAFLESRMRYTIGAYVTEYFAFQYTAWSILFVTVRYLLLLLLLLHSSCSCNYNRYKKVIEIYKESVFP